MRRVFGLDVLREPRCVERGGLLAAATRVQPGGALPKLAGSVHSSSTTVTPSNMNGLSLTRNGIPLAVVTFSRMTSLVLT